MPSSLQSEAVLRPLLERCGYTGARLAINYKVGDKTYPFVGFASKPWDFDSACIAVVDAHGDAEEAVKACRELGTPVVWVRQNGKAEWWVQREIAITHFGPPPGQDFVTFVRERERDLHPLSVYRAKTLGRLPGARQLDFVDVGLLPMLREQAGKKLGHLVEGMTRITLKGLGQSNPSKAMLRDIFIRVFRLVAGKILKDKGVGDFGSLNLADPASVLRAVGKHYSAADAEISLPHAWKVALKAATSLFADAPNLRVVSPETLAYVYEHTLVSKALRKKLGIHATPPWLVDYMVWQLYDWIHEIPVNDRNVFEPACGHSPFLLASMRMLRMDMQDQSEARVHSYLKAHIHGVEIDEFAREIARLSLTLADIPNPNGWDLEPGDMFDSNILATETAQCRILLSNPPYEKFEDKDKVRYAAAGHPVSHKKAVELLSRTLKHLRPGSVFAVVVPQTVVSGPEAKAVREYMLREFEIAEVCLFPGKVFEFAEIETAIILGRRRIEGQPVGEHRVRLRTIDERGVQAFRDNYSATVDTIATQSRLQENPAFELKIPALHEVWDYLQRNSRIRDVALVGRGIEYKGEIARNHVAAVVPKPKQGYAAGFAGVSRDQTIVTTPPECGLATRSELIGNPRQGEGTGDPQILVNMGRTARSPWRIKAMLDSDGKPVKNNFAIVRPARNGDFALYLWAILNSPVASAFVASRTMRKHNYEGLLGEIPLPRANDAAIRDVVHAARDYRAQASQRGQVVIQQKTQKHRERTLFDVSQETARPPSDAAVCEALLRLDATVLRLYALPVRLERMLIEYFRGYVRRGVVCTFGDYYPADFKSLLPLHKFISSAYRGSTVGQVADRMKSSERAAVNAALHVAAAAFGGDE